MCVWCMCVVCVRVKRDNKLLTVFPDATTFLSVVRTCVCPCALVARMIGCSCQVHRVISHDIMWAWEGFIISDNDLGH